MDRIKPTKQNSNVSDPQKHFKLAIEVAREQDKKESTTTTLFQKQVTTVP